MARKVKGPDVEEAQDEGETADGRSFVGITKNKLLALVARQRTLQGKVDEIAGEMGSNVAKGVDKSHLHKGAFARIMRLERMDQVKREEELYHFHLYCKHMGYMTSDLFRDGVVATEGASNVHRLQQAAE